MKENSNKKVGTLGRDLAESNYVVDHGVAAGKDRAGARKRCLYSTMIPIACPQGRGCRGPRARPVKGESDSTSLCLRGPNRQKQRSSRSTLASAAAVNARLKS